MITGVFSLLSLALFFFLPQSVIAQAYPKQAINLIIPLAQGGGIRHIGAFNHGPTALFRTRTLPDRPRPRSAAS